MTLAIVPLVAVKLPVETPVTASLKVAVKLIGPLVTGATMLSVTVATDGAMVSTVSVVEVVAELPAASVAIAVTVSGPWPAGVTDVLQWPVPSTATAAPFTVSEEPISAVPLTWMPPAASAALMVLSPPSIVVIATEGAMVSTVSVVEVVAELPAASVATAVTVSGPWPAGVTDVLQWPVPSTATAAPFTVSEEPISAVPLIWMPPAASAALMVLSPPSIVVIATEGAMVSTVSVVEVVAELPAASVATAVTVSGPWPAGVTDVLQWPVPSTATAAPFTVSEEPISAVPLIWMPPAASAALMVLSPPSIVVIATEGAMVSTVSVVEVVAELPAASVATAVTVSAPWPAGVTDVLQWPVPSTATAAPFTVSEEPISAVPLIWMPPAASAALMVLSPPSIVVIATEGAMVSTVSVVEVVAELPAASVATAVTVSGPWPAGVTDVLQWPVPSTATAAPFTVSEEPISAVPLIWMPPAASAALMVLSPPSIVVIATEGAMVSTVSVVEVVAELPAASVATAVTVSGPWPAGVTDVLQWPVPSTATAAPFTVSEEPISAVPLIWMPPAASAALMVLSPPSIVVIATEGAMVSRVKLRRLLLPVLPATSVSLATML